MLQAIGEPPEGEREAFDLVRVEIDSSYTLT
jgi:hypothetical protein